MSSTTTTTPSFGISAPLSTAFPTATDVSQTEALLQTLKEKKSFESIEETKTRIEVLRSLNRVVRNWEMSQSAEGYQPSARLMAFGSYRLGVHSSGGDIDTLLVAPRHITRSQFFSSFKKMLEKDANVKGVNAVQEAFVPIITLHYAGVEVDILFARLDMAQVPAQLDLSDDKILKNLDEKDIRSLNGCRVAERLLKLIPDQKVFTLALRAVKLWAKSHGISSNAMGFFGGITWAILVARTCQLYPNASAGKIVQKVFFVFSTWNWPAPVVLDHLPANDVRVWSPAFNMADRYHLMPIITPAFPQQNSTHNVSRSTLHVIQEEMKEAYEICRRIEAGNAEWRDLFEEVNFFSRYKHFVALRMTAGTKEEETGFTGFLESRIRQLVQALERNPCIKIAHIGTESFKPKDNAPHSAIWFLGLEFADHAKSLDLTKTTEVFKAKLMEQATRAKVAQVKVDISFIKRSKLNELITVDNLRRGRFWKPTSSATSSATTTTEAGKKRKATEGASGAPAKRPLQVRN